MNHEIKFRGKRKDNGEWAYGHVFENEFSSWILYEQGVQLCPNTVNGPAEYDSEVDWVEVIPETVGQFCGLKDKNGKEIYEGDIYDNPCCIGLLVCVYSDGAFFGKHIGHEKDIRNKDIYGRIYPRCPNDRVEVIGNVHANPELLNV